MQKNAILNLAVNKETHVIRKHFTEDEQAALKEDFAQNAIVYNRLENEFTEVKKSFKERMTPVKEDSKRILEALKAGFEDVKMEVLLIPNEETREMHFYNETTGLKVGARPMTFEEKKFHTVLDRLPQKQEETF